MREEIVNQPLLKTENLSRTFGDRVALDSFSIEIAAGEVVGLIGGMGAGKTTTLKILGTLDRATSGTARIGGFDLSRETSKVRRIIGYLPDDFGIYPRLTVAQYMKFFASVRGVERKRRVARIEQCLQITETIELHDRSMGELNRDEKHRVGLAQVLLHDPRVLILDDPQSAMELRSRLAMYRLVRELATMGKAVLISARALDELAGVCDRAAILSAGNLLALGTIKELLPRLRQKRVIEIRVMKFAEVARQVLTEAPGAWEALDDDSEGLLRYEVHADQKQLSQALLMLLKRGIPVVHFHEIPMAAEDLTS